MKAHKHTRTGEKTLRHRTCRKLGRGTKRELGVQTNSRVCLTQSQLSALLAGGTFGAADLLCVHVCEHETKGMFSRECDSDDTYDGGRARERFARKASTRAWFLCYPVTYGYLIPKSPYTLWGRATASSETGISPTLAALTKDFSHENASLCAQRANTMKLTHGGERSVFGPARLLESTQSHQQISS